MDGRDAEHSGCYDVIRPIQPNGFKQAKKKSIAIKRWTIQTGTLNTEVQRGAGAANKIRECLHALGGGAVQ
jgi:hypothetical protein